jgi:purine-binding chemotaxis protein CheW
VDARTEERSLLDLILVVFRLNERELALRSQDVVEIIRMVAVTPIPETNSWLKGVINIRGRITPVIDLRARLGLASVEPGLENPIVVTEVGDRQIGLIVDSMVGIEAVSADALEQPDRLAGPLHAVSAMVTVGSRVILVLDLERVCAGVESLSLPGADGVEIG